MILRLRGGLLEKMDFEIEAFALKKNGGIQLIDSELRTEKPDKNKGFVISISFSSSKNQFYQFRISFSPI